MHVMKVLIVGAGPTGALLASALQSKCRPPREPLDIHVWEMNSRIGGRFQSFTDPETGNANALADLGAQYLTQSLNCTWSQPYFDELVATGLLKELDTSSFPGFRQDATKKNFVCVKGTGSVVEHYFAKANVLEKIKLSQALTQLKVSGEKDGTGTGVAARTGESGAGVDEVFDVVISTIPVPELLLLKDIAQYAKDTELSIVKYTSRFALGIFFHEKVQLLSNHQALNFAQNPSNAIRYWSIEHLKRCAGDYELANSNSELPALVVHSSVDYGAQHAQTDRATVANDLLHQLKTETKLTQHSQYSVICYRWNCSQVSVPYPNSAGYVVLHAKPLILTCGDGFTGSGFEGCIKSAEETAKYLQQQYFV